MGVFQPAGAEGPTLIGGGAKMSLKVEHMILGGWTLGCRSALVMSLDVVDFLQAIMKVIGQGK